MKTALYDFIGKHGERLNLLNPQFALESGPALDRRLTWYGHDEKLEDARLHAELGTCAEYFEFCIRESYYSLQIADGSLIQMHLRADAAGFVEGGSLALVPRPGNGFDYLRFDYEPNQARHYRHNRYHGHFGFHASSMRISLYHFPWPSEFIAFIAHLMSDEKGRTLKGGDFQVPARITGFYYDHLLENLESVGERFNHSFRLWHCNNGGTRGDDLIGNGWVEEISDEE